MLRDQRDPTLTGTVGLAEIKKLNRSPNGQFRVMDQDDRVNFELHYNCILDIQERDLEVDLARALPLLLDALKDYWLIAALAVEPLARENATAIGIGTSSFAASGPTRGKGSEDTDLKNPLTVKPPLKHLGVAQRLDNSVFLGV